MWEESTCLRFRENMMVHFARFAPGTGQGCTEYSVPKKDILTHFLKISKCIFGLEKYECSLIFATKMGDFYRI